MTENAQPAPAGETVVPEGDWMATADALGAELMSETPLAEVPSDEPETVPEPEVKEEKPEEQEAGAEDAAAEEDPTGQPEEEGSEPETAIAPPNSWPAEMKAKWGEVPPEMQQIIAQRDTESHQQISRMGQEIAQFKPIGELLGENQDVFDRHGMSAADGLKTLISAQNALDANPEQALVAIANSFGIDLATLAGLVPEGERPTQDAIALATENRQLKQQLAEQQNRQTIQEQRANQARQAEAAEAVTKWATDPKNPKPYFEQVRGTMARLMEDNPSATLDDLYDRACNADPEIRQKLLSDTETQKAEETRKAKAKEVSDAKKAKVVNTGTSKPTSPAKSGSWDDDKALSDKFDEIMARS